MNSDRLLQRFLRYVKIDTTARESVEQSPSSPGQRELGRLLVDELQQAGAEEVKLDEYGLVTALVPATTDRKTPTIAFCAHLDTSPETPGDHVKPQVVRDYRGGDLVLPGNPDRVIRVDENRALENLIGRTIITSDGTTLLGADDKSGLAAIVEAAAWMIEHPEIEHGPVRICFTCDEEIGRGADHVDIEQLGAVVCYTLDSEGADMIDVETFSADLALVTFTGVNIHPSIAKHRMTNAVRVAADFLERLPRDRISPESTDGTEGFLHPYEISGGVAETTLRILLREFETAQLGGLADLLWKSAAETEAEFPSATVSIAIRPQYRNLADGLTREPRAVAYAQQALERLGRTAKLTRVRGGTDGARFTEMGLPTPNLSSGQHTPHSPLEWACLEEMVQAAEWIGAIAQVWACG